VISKKIIEPQSRSPAYGLIWGCNLPSMQNYIDIICNSIPEKVSKFLVPTIPEYHDIAFAIKKER
jgi:hypothetical protein